MSTHSSVIVALLVGVLMMVAGIDIAATHHDKLGLGLFFTLTSFGGMIALLSYIQMHKLKYS